MAARHQIARLVALIAFSLVAVASSHATTVRGGSGYGSEDSTCTVTGNSSGNPCEYFSQTALGTVGANNIVQFTYCCSSGVGQVLDVVDVGQLTGSESFTLPSAFFGATTEVFACGLQGASGGVTSSDGATSLSPSSGTLNAPGYGPNQPCTSLSATTDYTFTLSSSGANTITFTTDAGFDVTGDLVVDSTVPSGSSQVPEPSTLMLTGIGLVAVGRKFRSLCSRGDRQISN